MAVQDIDRIVIALRGARWAVADSKANVCEDTWKALYAMDKVLDGFMRDLYGLMEA